MAAIGEAHLEGLQPVERLRMLARLETARRLQAVISHDVIAGLYTEDPAAIGGPVTKVVADWLRITPTDARRRLRDAQQLSARTTLTGQVLPPELPATARAGATVSSMDSTCASLRPSCAIYRRTPRRKSLRAPRSCWPTRPCNCVPTNWKRRHTAAPC